ncbi:MAG: YgjP-like metallopeptidase domain-containing protein [Collinsella sp.]
MHAQTGAIRIARELAAYPIECLDMVVAHELVHLLEPSHNQRFHALLDTYCPNNELCRSGSSSRPSTL